MKYVYYYQTKDNENRTGEINARDRAEAYAVLRRQGIRPYRVAGDDPIRWRPYVVVGAFALLLTAVVLLLGYAFNVKRVEQPIARHQISGDVAYIERQMALNWCDVLPTKLDQALALYVQPGREVFHPDLSEEEIAVLDGELKTPLEILDTDRSEVRQVKEIVRIMRDEIGELRSRGGTLSDYLNMLAERQDHEIDMREKAISSFRRTPRDMRRRAFAALNMRLEDAHLEPLPAAMLNE